MTGSPSSLEQQVRLALREAVAAELERKHRLGQYAVFWRDGRPVLEGPDAPPPSPLPEHPSVHDPP